MTEPRNDTEKLIHTALHTLRWVRGDSLQFSTPSQGHLRWIYEYGRNKGEHVGFSRDNYKQVLEWVLRVLNGLSEDRFSVPTIKADPKSWDEVMVEANRLFNEQWEEQRAEQQAEHDHDPADYMCYGPNAECVVDGKVIDPWSKRLTGPCRWWLENVTLIGVWLIYQHMADIMEEYVRDYLGDWADGNLDDDPRKEVARSYENFIFMLDHAVWALLTEAKAAADSLAEFDEHPLDMSS